MYRCVRASSLIIIVRKAQLHSAVIVIEMWELLLYLTNCTAGIRDYGALITRSVLEAIQAILVPSHHSTIVLVTYVILHYFITLSLSLTYPCSAQVSVASWAQVECHGGTEASRTILLAADARLCSRACRAPCWHCDRLASPTLKY